MTHQIALIAALLAAGARAEGTVRLAGRSLADDGGEFNAVGFTLMSGLHLYKFDRAQLEAELRAGRQAGYDFVRILGQVGGDYWRQRTIDPNWPDYYDQVLPGFLDLVHSHGLRTELTFFGGVNGGYPAELNSRPERQRFVERVIEVVRTRPQTVIYLEIANESWQTGWPELEGQDGSGNSYSMPNAELVDYGRMVRQAFPRMVVALSAPSNGSPQTYRRFTAGGFALSLHLDRDAQKADGLWRYVRQPWDAGLFGDPWTNNEPVGPGSSVTTDDDCERQVAAVAVTFIAKGFAHVFHTSAGVRSIPDKGYATGLVSEMPCFREVARAAKLLPPGLANFNMQNGHWDGSPWRNLDDFIEGGDGSSRGLMRLYSGTSGEDYVSALLHVPVGVRLECRRSGPVAFRRLPGLEVALREECSPGKVVSLGRGALLVLGGAFAENEPGDGEPAPACDPLAQRAPHWGVKEGACLRSCGLLGGTASFDEPCEQYGMAAVGEAYDVAYCCAASGSPSDPPDPDDGLQLGDYHPVPGFNFDKLRDESRVTAKYSAAVRLFSRAIGGLDPVTASLARIARLAQANGFPNARVVGEDLIDFGDGRGPIDVITSVGGPNAGWWFNNW